MARTPRPGVIPTALAMLILLTGCAEADPRDRAALEDLAEVAGPTSGIAAAAVTGTDCWRPTEHILDDVEGSTAWRVICRVHFREDDADRWLDTTCIGDFDVEPMLDHCYRWAPYSEEPAFEDHDSIPAGVSPR